MQQELETEELHFEASDGTRLAYYLWQQQPPSQCRALVLILHGIAFHARPYKIVAQSVAVEGATFVAMDIRGHGQSSGTPGELLSTARMVQDISDWVEHLQATFIGVPTFLIAESMSGPYGTLYTLDHPGSVDGLVLIAPATLPSWRQLVMSDSLNTLVSAITKPFAPSIELSGERLRMGSNSDEFPELRVRDPDAIQVVSPQYVLRIGEAIARLMGRLSMATATPVLILHGGSDKILSPFGSRVLYHRIASTDKNLMILPGASHTLFWDESSAAVYSIIGEWIQGRLPS
jgi:alpha-beta hydrolase superfamily lysophospholipase